ncbi:hypothetical protein FA95DRAFT_1387548 [Auriscalpium vulgare]|uniref:Uncharacterized protein n=1 Tax=Auriscalpium vulgare TaxID=40419 RepID=A0ACB8S8R1_9AGAM|nr:hypothetical protein FA95DRAFT_1387548 [Auriscalpium vulgare]
MVHDDAVTPSLQASPIGQSVASLLSKHCPPIFPLSTQNSEMTGVLRVPLQGYSSDIESEAWSNMPSGSVFGPHETAALPRRADDVGGKTPLAERPSGKAKGKGRATSQPDYSDVTPRETLQIEKNKQMRGEGSGSRLRLSSADMRRMRRMRMSTSFENTGVIAQPHSSVEEKAFHTHIDRDLPESSRARQLLIWCAARTEAGAGHPQEPCDKLPPLDASEARLVNDVRDAAIRMLAEGLIDTNVMSPADNKRNRAKKAQYTVDIERAQAEDNAWAEVEQFYKSRHATVMSDLEQRRKTKGKQGALGPDEWGPRDAELPERFHAGVKLARSVLASAGPSSQEKSPLDKRWSDVQDTVRMIVRTVSRGYADNACYQIDELHTLVNTATPTASVATADLARSFALMSLTLASHAQAHPHPHHPPAVSSASAALSAYLPPSTHEPDPQELFRALSRVDMARPPAQRGDAALRALREM